MDLTTIDRYREYDPALPDSDSEVIRHLISTCSEVLEQKCERTFSIQTYDELVDGTGGMFLYLKQRPVTQVQAVRYGTFPGLYVYNSDANNANATVQVTDTGLVLARSVNGVDLTPDTLLYATYPTLGDMNTAINALGNGWHSTNGGTPFPTWASSDLAALKATHGARFQTITLEIHRWYLSGYRLNGNLGELWAGSGWLRGYQNFRVKYTAGYSTTPRGMPDNLQGLCCELVKHTYQARDVNTNVQSESLGVWSYTNLAEKSFKNLSLTAQTTLQKYMARKLARWF